MLAVAHSFCCVNKYSFVIKINCNLVCSLKETNIQFFFKFLPVKRSEVERVNLESNSKNVL